MTTRFAGETEGIRREGDEENVAAFSFGSTRAKNSATPFPEEDRSRV
jgi:hypothetical protein